MSEAQETFYRLGAALAIGLLIGLERGWEERDAEGGRRVAGVRTYGLIGLLGGASVQLATGVGAWLPGLAFLGMAGVLTTAYVVNWKRAEDAGITSLVAGLLTFVLGGLAARGEVAEAAAFAVITTLLLSYKPVLHRWLQVLTGEELRAGLQLLLISVVLLPILPDAGYGPWQALNPRAIWWMVVLIAGISFAGYFAVKIGGARRGAVFTGLFAGLASSTALTLHFARMSHRERKLAPILAVGVLLACSTMFPRMLLVATVVHPALFRPVLVPALVMLLLLLLPAWVALRRGAPDVTKSESPLRNPLELRAALVFGALLVAVLLLARALSSWFGDTGVLALSAVSGLTDVDAITLSLARMARGEIDLSVAATGIVIASAVNNLAKAGLAAAIGGRDIARRVALPLCVSAAGGLLAVWLWAW